MNAMSDGLLATDEPPPFTAYNENGNRHSSSSAITRRSVFRGGAGLSKAECEGHMAWDIGAADTACCLIGKAPDAVWST
jgi:hypothetical protein